MQPRCDFVYISLTRHDQTGDDRSYLQWHQLEHMAEKYQFPGITGGQRWISTKACRLARAVEVDEWASVADVTSYLMGEPIEETLDDFMGTGRPKINANPAGMASAPSLPTHFQAPMKVLETYITPGIYLPPETLPFRPNRGVYFVVEEPTGETGWDDYLRQVHPAVVRDLLDLPGVAGAWALTSTPLLRKRERFYSPGHYFMTVYYLDDDPADVGRRLVEPLQRSWKGQPTKPLLGAPFESMLRLDVDSFGPGKD